MYDLAREIDSSRSLAENQLKVSMNSATGNDVQ